MKTCPTCNTQYPDDSLRFCLQDGSPLSDAFDTDTPTVVLDRSGGAETRGELTQRQAPPPLDEETVLAPRYEKRRSNTALIIVLTAVGMIVLFGIAGIAAWFYLRPQMEVNRNADADPDVRTPAVTPRISPAATSPAASPATNSNTRAAATPVDDQQIRNDVKAAITSWNTDAESLDFDSYMTHYAPTVDYYTRSGAGIAYIRADKQRAFSRYDSITTDITNVTVTADPSGETATAVFDKEWNFDGDRPSTGKVRQLMRFRKVAGEWLIIAEKDLKLYYKR
ncbi:MAG: nuclear transport factor 2 family protein [Pyrinomonadaceae bacterium]